MEEHLEEVSDLLTKEHGNTINETREEGISALEVYDLEMIAFDPRLKWQPRRLP
jgi:hypothetical protein